MQDLRTCNTPVTHLPTSLLILIDAMNEAVNTRMVRIKISGQIWSNRQLTCYLWDNPIIGNSRASNESPSSREANYARTDAYNSEDAESRNAPRNIHGIRLRPTSDLREFATSADENPGMRNGAYMRLRKPD